MQKIIKLILRKINFLFFNLISKILSAFSFNLELVPYRNWTSNIFIIYKKKINYELEKKKYFNFDVFFQKSDLRAVFPNYWDEESTRIASLFSLNKLFHEFDFFDIGANYGIYSLPFIKSKKIGRHLIVEANPFLVTCLEKTFEKTRANIISNAVTAFNVKKKLLFNIQPFGSGSSSLENSKKIRSPLSTLQLSVNSIGYYDMFQKYKEKKMQ